MKLLLGSLLLAGISWLGAAVVVPIMPNLDSQKIAKTWYPLLHLPTGQVVSTHFFPFRFLAQPNGDLKYNVRIPQDGRCTIEEGPLKKLGQPGDYTNSEVPFTIRIVETDYDSYRISYLTRESSKEETFLALAGTQPILTPTLETKFRQVATSIGITGEFLHPVLEKTC